MKVYKTQAQVEKDIKNGVLAVEGDVRFECSISIKASIKVTAGNINAWDINAWNINARNINALDINALDIDALDINAGDINARNINARDINAGDINARNIKYYAFCLVYKSIKCISIKAERDKHSEPICLDGELTYIESEETSETIEIAGHKYSKSEVEERLKGLKEL